MNMALISLYFIIILVIPVIILLHMYEHISIRQKTIINGDRANFKEVYLIVIRYTSEIFQNFYILNFPYNVIQ